MIQFVNAKINLGLDIVGRRSDGYHLLRTVFYPVGRFSGTPRNPEPFCDILELTQLAADDPDGYEEDGIRFLFGGNPVDCPPEKNLVVKAARKVMDHFGSALTTRAGRLTLRLEKHIPDGAGMGGGSADATFVMRMLNATASRHGLTPLTDDELRDMAVTLGADCPVFVANRPVYAEGIGDRFEDIPAILEGKWLLVVKPDLYVSTKEAFAGVTPRQPEFDLRLLATLPLEEWRRYVKNDFEESLFPKYPVLEELKASLYAHGAEYTSMTGSGAALYGIFADRAAALRARVAITAPFKAVVLL